MWRPKNNMPQGKGTYGSKKGRPPKKIKRTKKKKTGFVKAAKSIERRGTEGKCTPITKPGCTGRAKALAKTFKKMARDK